MKAFVFATLFTALIVADAGEAQVLAGGEFRVNEDTAGYLAFPSVAADASGAFVVVWADDGAPRAVRGRRFGPAGAPTGAEFRINERPVAGALRPDVAVDTTGRALAVWSNTDEGVVPGVFGRVFDAIGRPLGPQFKISSARAFEPSVAATPSGFVVVWSTDTFDEDTGGIAGRTIDVAGNPLGPEFDVSSATGYQYAVSVAAADSGSFVVAWTSYGYGSEAPAVLARRFGTGGAQMGREFAVTTSAAYGAEASVAVAADARFVVVWPGSNMVLGRRFSAGGVPVGVDFVVNSAPAPYVYAASVACDKSGNFSVFWDAGSLGERDVFSRRFTAAGAPRGLDFRVNATTTGLQQRPDAASDAAGNLFAAWVSDQSAVFQVFGQRVGGLVPAAMSVQDGDNGILEVADDFTLVTSWRNVNGGAQTFEGRASSMGPPAGLELTLSSAATTYGTVPNGTAAACGGQCFEGSLVGTRPPGHLDLGIVESLQPDAQGQAKRWRVHVGDSFSDVPRSSLYYPYVETLVHHSITGGCGASAYCPQSSATREQMAVFVLVGKEGAGYLPPRCATPAFADVPAASSFCPWVEEAARRGAAAGCGGANFCPGVPITREQMAVLVLRTLDPLFVPPACDTPMFEDVPASSPYCRWIEELARRGVVTACEPSRYCPTAPVTREQMAMFIAGTFGLELYGPALGHVPMTPTDSPAARGAFGRTRTHR